MPDAVEDRQHTSEVRGSEDEARRMMQALEARGWTVCPERVPLQGQLGYYCVQTLQRADGTCSERAHSIRWNLFESPLVPATIECEDETALLSFVLGHAQHMGFYFFHYGDEDGDVGFVCYCHAKRGYSFVMRISDDVGCSLSDEALALLAAFDDEDDDDEEDDEEP